jgi:hypothetical protein
LRGYDDKYPKPRWVGEDLYFEELYKMENDKEVDLDGLSAEGGLLGTRKKKGSVPGPRVPAGSDTGHLSNARRAREMQQSGIPLWDARWGWCQNQDNPKG